MAFLATVAIGSDTSSPVGGPFSSSRPDAQPSVAQQRQHAAAIAKLAAITRPDHSTLFFRITGFQISGYVRDGTVHMLALDRTKSSSHFRCVGEAISRDGSRLAYVNATEDGQRCRIVVLDIETKREKVLAEIDSVQTGHSVLRWSWDDTEIVCHELRGIFAISVKDGSRRRLARLPFRGDSWTWNDVVVHSLDWLHDRSELVADASACVPVNGASLRVQASGHACLG